MNNKLTSLQKQENVKYIHNITAKTYKEHFGMEWDNIDHINEFIKYVKNISQNPKVLELGSGWGYHSNYLRENGIDVCGIDISEEFIKIAKNEFPLCSFKNINALHLKENFDKDSINGIMAIYFFHFIPKEETENLWENISYVLKQNGYVFGVITAGNTGEQMLKTSCLKEDDERKLYMYNFSLDEWKDLFKKYGFEITYLKNLSNLEYEIPGANLKYAFIIKKIK